MVRPLPDEPGTPQADPASRRQDGERRAANDEHRFRDLLDASPIITWTATPQGRVTYVNRRLVEYTGMEPAREVDEWARESVHPGDRDRRLAAWTKAMAEGTEYQLELRIRRHDGVYRWFLARATPIKDERGEVVEWLGSATDIDERRRSEDNLRFLADVSIALGIVTDVESTLQRIARLAVPYFSDWCEVAVKDSGGGVRRLGVNHYDPERVKHAEALDRLYPRDEASVAARVMQSGDPVFMHEVGDEVLREMARDERHLEMLRKLGLRSFICVPMPNKAGIIGSITFATAESGRLYNEFDLQVAQELARRATIAVENAELVQALQEADRRKDEFLAVLAHELRNPLAPVRNAVEILRAADSPSPQLQWTHDVIDRQVRQMTRLVDDLLDVSRITSGKIDLRKERIELSAAMRLALEASRPLIERGGHELTVRFPSEAVEIEADLARIAQVVSNLLNNAARYTPPGGHIQLSAERQDGQLAIRVCDNGIGIATPMLGRIFDMFTQGGATAGRIEGGLGIGLTLVKRLVELHGGTVEAKSAGLGRGSEFVVRLPVLAVSPSHGDAVQKSLAGRPTVAPRRVLVVDDNRDAADSLSMLLLSRGHEVRCAYDGLEAVGSAIAFDPDVILMDIGLPKLSGYDAARRVREARGASVLLVAITGWGQDEDRRRSREAGFDFHLTKPVDPEAVARLIDEASQSPS